MCRGGWTIDEALISQYLGSNRNDIPEVALLNARAIPQQLQARFAEARARRSQLAQYGAAGVDAILRAVPKKLKEDHAALSQSPVLSEKFADAFLLLIFMNAIELLVDIDGPAVSPLLTALSDTDPDIRALAAAFLGVQGIAGQVSRGWFQRSAHDSTEAAVRTIFDFDSDFVVKFAAAVTLMQRGASDRTTRDQAEQYFTRFLDTTMPHWRDVAPSPVEVYMRLLPQLIATRQ